jgi:mono/diheme cytochrome c family protein
MQNRSLLLMGFLILVMSRCGEVGTNKATAGPGDPPKISNEHGGFESQVKWGEHLVIVSACHDCHTPKKMTDRGPVLDSSRLLSGYHSGVPKMDLDRAGLAQQGVSATIDLTEWVGPWGTSFTANLTPDPTGTGAWTEEQFMTAIREGKFKGLKEGRPLLPPMPWEMYRHMTDQELKAIYAYLRTVPPVNNVVPPPLPPSSASK